MACACAAGGYAWPAAHQPKPRNSACTSTTNRKYHIPSVAPLSQSSAARKFDRPTTARKPEGGGLKRKLLISPGGEGLASTAGRGLGLQTRVACYCLCS